MTARHSPPVIAHVIYALTTGGLENGLVNIINRIPPERFRHVIVCITSADDFADRITNPSVEIVELHKQAGHDFGFYCRLWRLFRKLRPEIIHSRNLAALETQLLSIGCAGVRRVHGEHGREITDLDGSNWKYLAFRRLMRLFVHHYIAVSRDLQRWLEEDVGVRPQNVTQIYNGVDHQRFSADSVNREAVLPGQWQGQDDKLIIGTVGRLTPVKDQRLLLQAVALLREREPELFRRLRVVIVGDGPLRSELDTLVSELKLEREVWLPGNRDDVPVLLAAMDLFVLPSLAEGISNTVLEAMAAGLPVIATAVGGNLELVEEGVNGALVPVGDAEALAAAISSVLADDARRATMGCSARQRTLDRFDWDRTVKDYLAVYEQLLGAAVAQTTGIVD